MSTSGATHIDHLALEPNEPPRAPHASNPTRVRYFDCVARARFGADRDAIQMLCIGGGQVPEALAGLGYPVTGVEVPAGGSVHALPAAGGTVDVVVISDVLERLPDLPAAVAEISRVLRPGGVVVFDTINRTITSRLIAAALRRRSWRMFIRPGELREVFAEHGLILARVRGIARGEFGMTDSTAVRYIGHAIKKTRP